MRRFTVGAISPSPSDGSSFYRCMGPMQQLRKQFDVELITGEWWAWDKVGKCDMLFLHRPCAKAHAIVAETAKEMGIPVVVDYDDNLFIVPRWNPAYDQYATQEARDMMVRCIQIADAVITSTPIIGQALRGLNPKVTVIPNAFNDFIWKFNRQPRNKIISWRGSITHHADMQWAIEPMRRVAESYPDWTFHFVGCPHWDVDEIPRRVRHEWVDNFFGYLNILVGLNPAINLVPLRDHEFNRGKSNVGWIEASLAGAVTIAPDFEEWRRPGVVRYGSRDTFETVIETVIGLKDEQRADLVAQSQQWIFQNIRLSEMNRVRMGLFHEVANWGPPKPCVAHSQEEKS